MIRSNRGFPLSAIAAAIIASFGSGPAEALDPGEPASPEILVNDEVNQFDVAMDADGDFIVVGTSLYTGYGADNGLFARRFDFLGKALGPTFPINLEPFAGSGSPAIASAPDGRFVVVWSGSKQSSRTSPHVYAQLYQADGAPSGDHIEVTPTGSSTIGGPDVAMRPSGGFIVVYSGGLGIYARRFDPTGSPLGGEIEVATADSPDRARVAAAGNGEFVVVWFANQTDERNVFARRFSANGVALGPAFRATEMATGDQGDQEWPDVAMDSDGDFVVVWQSFLPTDYNVYARRFSSDGTPLTGDLLVNEVTACSQSFPSVASDADGDFVVAWHDRRGLCGLGSTGIDIWARAFSSTGVPLGGEHQVSSEPGNDDYLTEVSMDSDGDYVVTWVGSSYRFHARRYVGHENIDLAVSKSDNADPATVSEPFSYTLAVSNLHPPSALTPWSQINSTIGSARAVRVFDTVPEGLTVNSYGGAGWTCLFTAPDLTCDLMSPLQAGATDSILEIEVVKHLAGTVTNTALASAVVQYDSNSGNNSDSETTNVGTADLVPDPFEFVDRTGVLANTAVTSVPVTISGIDGAATLELGGDASRKWSKNGGLFTSAPGTVVNGDAVRLRVRSSATGSAAVNVVAMIGTVSDVWSVTTAPDDTAPDPFQFVDYSTVATGTVYESEPVTISGINKPAPISLTGHASRKWSKNGGVYVSASGTVVQGDVVRLKLTSAPKAEATVTATANIGGVLDSWTVTTGSSDITPAAFTFNDVSNAATSAVITSNTITVSGINTSVPVRLSGSIAGDQYSKNGGAFTSANGTVGAGDTIRLRMTSSASASTAKSLKCIIGTRADNWTVTTAP